MSLRDTKNNNLSSFFSLSFFNKNETLIKYTLLPSIPLSIIAILSANPNIWVTSAIHHFYIELLGAIFAMVLALYYISRAHTLNDKFSLFIGIGFLVNSLIDFFHVIVSISFMNEPLFLKYFIPQTWFAGRIFLSGMLAIAIAGYSTLSKGNADVSYISKHQKQEGEALPPQPPSSYLPSGSTLEEKEVAEGQEEDEQPELQQRYKLPKLFVVSLVALAIVSAGAAISSFFIIYPDAVIDNFYIHRPYEIPPLVLFLVALLYFYKNGLYKKSDVFYKGILLSLVFDSFGELIMSYSATSFDTAHNVAHVLKDAGYFVNMIALAMSGIQYNIRLQQRNALIQLQYKKLKESEKMKDEFINVAAHELRTPIQPILGLSDIIHSEVTNARHRELLEVVIRNAKRLKRLTENVLDVTKIESHSLKLNKEQVNLNIIVSEVLKEYRGKIEDKRNQYQQLHQQGLKISYELVQKDDDIIVEADRNRLAQVISNLLSNAIKFSNDDGQGIITITVETKNNNQDVIIGVKDTGPGIDPEDFPNLFTKFFTKSDKGTGLGLFICKSIVEGHGGKIWAENNKDAIGATFSFSLPIVSRG